MKNSIFLDNTYEVKLLENGLDINVLKYDEGYRKFKDDDLMLCLFYKIQELEEENRRLAKTTKAY